MDPASWICAILADFFASSQERDKEAQAYDNELKKLQKDLDQLKRELDHLKQDFTPEKPSDTL